MRQLRRLVADQIGRLEGILLRLYSCQRMDGKHAATILQELLERFGYSNPEFVLRSRKLGPDFMLGRNWLSNIRNKNAIPDLRKLYAISEIFHLSLGDLLELFGFPLHQLASMEATMHRTRTRLIEHRIHDIKAAPVPAQLLINASLGRTAYLSQIVGDWRTVSTSHLQGPLWRNNGIFYAKLGLEDSNAAPAIPPGAYIQVLRTKEISLFPPTPTSIYLIQTPWGLSAFRCSLQGNMLYLHSENPSYSGPFRLRNGSQARILGIVTAFAAELPAEPYRRAEPFAVRAGSSSPLAPWEFQRPNDLFFEQFRRQGLSRREFDGLALTLSPFYGLDASAKYLEELHSSDHFPRTSTALALSILTATRLSDVFASCGVRRVDRNKFHLQELLAFDCRHLPKSYAAPTPQPEDLWLPIRRQLRDWPIFLSDVPTATDNFRNVVRFERKATPFGFLSILPELSYLSYKSHRGGYRSLNSDAGLSDWARRLYLIEHGRPLPKIDCGYLTFVDDNVLLAPHRSASARSPVIFKKQDLTILGAVTGIAAPADL